MSSYVVIASKLSADTPVGYLMAASAVVMFAASLPISFAGWGVREISAVFALGTVGVEPAAALVTAVLIGIGSLSVVAILAGVSLGRKGEDVPVTPTPRPTIDYAHLLSMSVPLAVAGLILFQVHVPIEIGYLNINLADPFAMLGGAFFIITVVALPRRWPE